MRHCCFVQHFPIKIWIRRKSPKMSPRTHVYLRVSFSLSQIAFFPSEILKRHFQRRRQLPCIKTTTESKPRHLLQFNMLLIMWRNIRYEYFDIEFGIKVNSISLYFFYLLRLSHLPGRTLAIIKKKDRLPIWKFSLVTPFIRMTIMMKYLLFCIFCNSKLPVWVLANFPASG